jgi:hypothetical protein
LNYWFGAEFSSSRIATSPEIPEYRDPGRTRPLDSRKPPNCSNNRASAKVSYASR